tara:strand:- start:107 stop:958 length:852 start_codon:yes stop_codon:yes gene_type:complete
MKKHKIIEDSLILPNRSLITDQGASYIRHIADLSEKIYDSKSNFTVQYGEDIRESLDIFVPDNLVEPLPVLIFIHGGYCLNGSKEMMGYLAEDILKLPMIFVSVGYKLAPEHKFPVALNDCKHGIEKAYGILEQYGGDKNKVVIAGHSAGGNLAMLLLIKRYLNIPLDSIKLCASVCGVFNIHDTPLKVKSNYIEKEEDHVDASPLYQRVSEFNVPCLLIIGNKDFANVQRDHELMSAKLKYNNCNVHSMIEEGMDHYDLTFTITKNSHRWIDFVRSKAYGDQ